MNQQDIDFYKKLLVEEKEELIKEIMDADESTKDLIEKKMHNVNDSADEAANIVSQNILNIVNATSRKTLLAIEAAMRRIEENIYGQCVGCGKIIGDDRLKKIPWATMCIDCKNRNEKQR